MSIQNPNEPPLRDFDKILIGYIVFIIIFLICFLIALNWAKESEAGGREIDLNDCFLKAHNEPIIHTEFLEDTYLISSAPPFLVEGKVLSSLMEKIIYCESGGDPKVCSYKGCYAGMGLCQIIPSTLRYCEEKLGRELDPFDPEDNLECGMWLLENEGSEHWLQSKSCWSKL